MSAKCRYFFIHVTVPENEGQHEDGEDDEREVPAQVHNLSPNNNFNKNILFQFILRVFYKYCPGVFVLLRSLHPSSRLAFRDSNKVLILSYRLRLECSVFRRNTYPAEFRFYGIPRNFTAFCIWFPTKSKISVKFRQNSVVRHSAGHSSSDTAGKLYLTMLQRRSSSMEHYKWNTAYIFYYLTQKLCLNI